MVDRAAAAFRDLSQIRITSRVAIDLQVMADETELAARPEPVRERAPLRARHRDRHRRRHGELRAHRVVGHRQRARPRPGVAPEKLVELATPFFRGDAARTAATGAGLGLAIVDKAMQRMGGTLELANAPEGGLVAHLRFRRVP
jgi:two-component system, OmpR family, osmolarity sensor histidine kinase EnvZ